MRLLLYMGLFLTASASAQSAAKVTPFGYDNIFPAPAGILFPSLPTAAGINPGVLGNSERATALQLAYGPPTDDTESHRYFAGIGSARKGWGYGFGLDGSSFDGSFTNGAYAGLGVDLERAGLGMAVREADLADGFSPSVDLGLVFGKGAGFKAGFVIYGLEDTPQMNIGVGYSASRRYNIEANALLPAFSAFSSGSFALSLGANLNVEFLNFLFRATYYTASDRVVNTLGVGIWFSQKVNLGVQVSTPHEWTAGLTLVL